VVPAGSEVRRPVDPLKYQTKREPTGAASGELLTLKLRWKAPEGSESTPLELAVADPGASFASASADSRFAAAVAAFGMVLRSSPHRGVATYESVLAMAEDAGAERADAHRREFLALVKKAQALALPIGS
jgi:Ca-activated chloride channel family protein